MILEELVVKLAQRLTALERVLKEKGFLDEVDIQDVIASEAKELPEELGEKVRFLNHPETITKLAAKQKDVPWAKLKAIEERLAQLEAKSVSTKVNKGGISK